MIVLVKCNSRTQSLWTWVYNPIPLLINCVTREKYFSFFLCNMSIILVLCCVKWIKKWRAIRTFFLTYTKHSVNVSNYYYYHQQAKYSPHQRSPKEQTTPDWTDHINFLSVMWSFRCQITLMMAFGFSQSFYYKFISHYGGNIIIVHLKSPLKK